MEIVQVLGLVAGAFTTISFVPQVIKALRTKSVHDLSLIMLVLFMLGLVLWLVYGIILTAWPIILANSITLVLSAVLLYFKVRYR